MTTRIKAKLKSRSGETLGETLMALLISALALTMLAGAISAAANIVTTSKTQMTKYYAADSKLAEQNTKSDEDGTYTYAENYTVRIVQDAESDPITQEYTTAKGFQNNAFPGVPVIAYKGK